MGRIFSMTNEFSRMKKGFVQGPKFLFTGQGARIFWSGALQNVAERVQNDRRHF